MTQTDTKEKILHCAFELFLGNGYKDVSIQDIAVKLGITKGGFYHYFSSKEELFLVMMEVCYFNFMEELVSRLTQNTTNFHEKLSILYKFYFEDFASGIITDSESYEGFYALFLDSLRRFEELQKKTQHVYTQIAAILKASIQQEKKSGNIHKDTDTELIVFEILSLIEGSILLGIINKERTVSKNVKKSLQAIEERIYINDHHIRKLSTRSNP